MKPVDESLEQEDLIPFLPEGLVAALAIVTAPIWAVVLIVKHHALLGIFWWVGAWSLGYLAFCSYKKGDRGGLFLAIGGTAALVLLVNKWSH